MISNCSGGLHSSLQEIKKKEKKQKKNYLPFIGMASETKMMTFQLGIKE